MEGNIPILRVFQYIQESRMPILSQLGHCSGSEL